MTEKFMRQIFDDYEPEKGENTKTTVHSRYEYSISNNSMCAIHTWIVRRKRKPGEKYIWLMPLPTNIH